MYGWFSESKHFIYILSYVCVYEKEKCYISLNSGKIKKLKQFLCSLFHFLLFTDGRKWNLKNITIVFYKIQVRDHGWHPAVIWLQQHQPSYQCTQLLSTAWWRVCNWLWGWFLAAPLAKTIKLAAYFKQKLLLLSRESGLLLWWNYSKAHGGLDQFSKYYL